MEENKELTASNYDDMNTKWDACIDLSLRRFVYSSLACAFGGLIFFSLSLFPSFLLQSIRMMFSSIAAKSSFANIKFDV
ncbi:hypothetical protein HRI_003319500 [Hibiscus trionum]|uniref:Uncharacterized protein n=1 Tax=Hibiscus trionum TaxID=183268 RepID=A0A9W7IJZ9_HIBTR|nr:hypothetical protein HRI_003319500 [Hibiscus trionum]